MKTLIFSLLIGLTISLFGCGSLVQEVNPAIIPTATTNVVVHSFISPQDTLLTVYVQAPRSVLGTQFVDYGYTNYYERSVQNAVVKLSDGTTTVQLLGVGGDFPLYYAIDARKLPIVAGHTYTLTVSTPYFPPVTAQCTLPAQVKPTEIRLDSTTQMQFDYTGVTYISRLIWQDPSGQANYYQVSGRTTETSTYNTQYQPNSPRHDTTTTGSSTVSFSRSTLISDQNQDGSQLISPKGERTLFSSANQQYNAVILTLGLSAVDENYYRYRSAIAQQTSAADNPFAEPVLIPSNIVGGLGCFGALNQASLSVRVK